MSIQKNMEKTKKKSYIILNSKNEINHLIVQLNNKYLLRSLHQNIMLTNESIFLETANKTNEDEQLLPFSIVS